MTEVKKRLIKWVALPMVLVGMVLVLTQILPIKEWLLSLGSQKEMTVGDYLDDLSRWSHNQLQDTSTKKFAPEKTFSERVITRDTFLYDKDGKSLRKLEPGRVVRLLIPGESLNFEGFSEKCVLVSILIVTEEKEEEVKGYVRESAVSAIQPTDYWQQKSGSVEAVWWDMPLEDKMIIHKAVKLYPGQCSDILSFVPRERGKYHFWTSGNAQFRAWINNEEVIFGPSGMIKCPPINGFGRVKVKLSPMAEEFQTVRFVVEKR